MKDKPLNVIEAKYPEFYEWLKQISRWKKVEDFIIPNYKNGVMVYFYTKDHKYSVSARLPRKIREQVIQTDENDNIEGESNTPIDDGYLGCIVKTRKPRAGEDWNRGNDLPDGSYSKETWNKIKNAIIAYELVRVVNPPKEKDIK